MDVSIVSHDENELVLLMEKTEPAITNAIRRTAIGEVPVMAIDNVTFYENSSVMPDEYIAHRLAMVPVKTDLKAYKWPVECCGGNCASCSVDLTIDEAGPKMVYSSDIKTSDQKVKPVSGKIPIIELMAGQRLRVEAKAVLGKGEDHAKWSVGLASYKYFPVVLADYRKIKDIKAIAAACPIGALEAKAGKLEVDPVKCTQCHECVRAAGDAAAFSMGTDRTRFVFRVETNGQMAAKDAISQAVQKISEKVKSMQTQL